MGSKGRSFAKYMPITLLSQCKLALTAINTLLPYKIIGAPKKFKNYPRPLFKPRTGHACPQKPNPSRGTVPLKVHKREKFCVSDFEFFTIL
jgi:hypothetical protein